MLGPAGGRLRPPGRCLELRLRPRLGRARAVGAGQQAVAQSGGGGGGGRSHCNGACVGPLVGSLRLRLRLRACARTRAAARCFSGCKPHLRPVGPAPCVSAFRWFPSLPPRPTDLDRGGLRLALRPPAARRCRVEGARARLHAPLLPRPRQPVAADVVPRSGVLPMGAALRYADRERRWGARSACASLIAGIMRPAYCRQAWAGYGSACHSPTAAGSPSALVCHGRPTPKQPLLLTAPPRILPPPCPSPSTQTGSPRADVGPAVAARPGRPGGGE
jgi:hypothetical protein